MKPLVILAFCLAILCVCPSCYCEEYIPIPFYINRHNRPYDNVYIWAFGKGYHSLSPIETKEAWNVRHKDIFEAFSYTNWDEFLLKVQNAHEDRIIEDSP